MRRATWHGARGRGGAEASGQALPAPLERLTQASWPSGSKQEPDPRSAAVRHILSMLTRMGRRLLAYEFCANVLFPRHEVLCDAIAMRVMLARLMSTPWLHRLCVALEWDKLTVGDTAARADDDDGGDGDG